MGDHFGIEWTDATWNPVTGCTKVSLYLFPGGIGIARNLGAFAKRAKAPLNDLIPGWRELKRARLAAGERLTYEAMAAHDQPFVLEFMNRMRTLGYQYPAQGEPYFTNEKNVRMYHLLFFSQHPVGLTLCITSRGSSRVASVSCGSTAEHGPSPLRGAISRWSTAGHRSNGARRSCGPRPCRPVRA